MLWYALYADFHYSFVKTRENHCVLWIEKRKIIEFNSKDLVTAAGKCLWQFFVVFTFQNMAISNILNTDIMIILVVFTFQNKAISNNMKIRNSICRVVFTFQNKAISNLYLEDGENILVVFTFQNKAISNRPRW